MLAEAFDCFTDGHRWYSRRHPDRCVQELLFGGYALYERNGAEGVHCGVCSETGALQWLNGVAIEDVEGQGEAERDCGREDVRRPDPDQEAPPGDIC